VQSGETCVCVFSEVREVEKELNIHVVNFTPSAI
jgi:hypothetical protein